MGDLDGFNYTGGDSPERLEGALVTWQWFDVFNVARCSDADSIAKKTSPAQITYAVLSFGAWKRLLAVTTPSSGGHRTEQNPLPRRGVCPPISGWPSEADLFGSPSACRLKLMDRTIASMRTIS